MRDLFSDSTDDKMDAMRERILEARAIKEGIDPSKIPKDWYPGPRPPKPTRAPFRPGKK